MFSETLRIKPVLDNATAKQMEMNLSARFSRVASRFGQGLKNVIKGSFVAMTLGLISRLLNPIEALEAKIKALLGEGTEARELADRFGSTTGEVVKLQAVAQAKGVTPDKLTEMVTQYAEAIEKGREELRNPHGERSESTIALKEFMGEKNHIKGFINFITSLKAGEVTGKPTNQVGAIPKTALEISQGFQKEIFGHIQYGAAKRFIESNVGEESKRLNLPTTELLTQSYNKSASLADQKRVLDIQNNTNDFVAATRKINGQTIQAMGLTEKLEKARSTKELDSFEVLKRGELSLEKMKESLIEINNSLVGGLGKLDTLFMNLKTIQRFFERISAGGKGE